MEKGSIAKVQFSFHHLHPLALLQMLHDAYCSFSGNSAEQFWNNQRARQIAWHIVNIYIYNNIYTYIIIYICEDLECFIQRDLY